MSLKAKLLQLENEIEMLYNRDPDNPRIHQLEAEADGIAEELTRIDDIMKEKERQLAEALKKKVEDIRNLDRLGETDELIDKYGEEFINDYHVDNLTIHSNVSEEQWTEDNEAKVNKKIRQLLYYRIYDNYIRVRG